MSCLSVKTRLIYFAFVNTHIDIQVNYLMYNVHKIDRYLWADDFKKEDN